MLHLSTGTLWHSLFTWALFPLYEIRKLYALPLFVHLIDKPFFFFEILSDFNVLAIQFANNISIWFMIIFPLYSYHLEICFMQQNTKCVELMHFREFYVLCEVRQHIMYRSISVINQYIASLPAHSSHFEIYFKWK